MGTYQLYLCNVEGVSSDRAKALRETAIQAQKHLVLLGCDDEVAKTIVQSLQLKTAEWTPVLNSCLPTTQGLSA